MYKYKVALKNNDVVALEDLAADQLMDLQDQLHSEVARRYKTPQNAITLAPASLVIPKEADAIAKVKLVARHLEASGSKARIYSNKLKDGTRRIKFYDYDCESTLALAASLPTGVKHKFVTAQWNSVQSLVIYIPAEIQ